MRRVVVTGLGAITPIGNTVEKFWENIKEGIIGIDNITKFDTSRYEVKLAGEVKNFVAKEHMDFKKAKRMSAFSQYAVCAANQAVNQAQLNMSEEDPYRVGVSIGSGIGGLGDMEEEAQKLMTKGNDRVKPMLVPMMISNMAAGNVAIDLGAKGKCINVVTACATGTHSIGEAYRSIQCGEADVMIAGGTESSITPLGLAGFNKLTALTKETDKTKASIPFDKNRSGFVMGEGAGVVVVEELQHAKERGAKILCEIVGYGATCDAYHVTSPAEDGSGAAMAMIFAMKEAGVKPEEIDYINAHGTSTHHNDLFETRAIKLALKDAAYNVKINSTKSMIGHLLGAAGGVEFITCVKSIEDNYIHQTVGLKNPDEECDLNYMAGKGEYTEVNVAMTNSLGFGGHNASLIIKKFIED